MNRVVAVAGKGGVGKTTLAGLLVLRMAAMGKTPILAVDADPNSCLDGVLGLSAETSVGALREHLDEARAMNMDKRRYLEMKIAEALTEGDDFDLVAMGRPEGPGCYCYANNVLKDVLAQVADSYPYMVVDNEAGLENLSRRLLTRVHSLVLVGDASRRGLDTVLRLYGLAREMGIEHERLAVVVNRVREGVEPVGLDDLAEKTGADVLLTLPEDLELARLDAAGESLAGLPGDNSLLPAVDGLIEKLGV